MESAPTDWSPLAGASNWRRIWNLYAFEKGNAFGEGIPYEYIAVNAVIAQVILTASAELL